MGGQTAGNARKREAETGNGSGDGNNRQRRDQKHDQRQAAQKVMQEFGVRGGCKLPADRRSSEHLCLCCRIVLTYATRL